MKLTGAIIIASFYCLRLGGEASLLRRNQVDTVECGTSHRRCYADKEDCILNDDEQNECVCKVGTVRDTACMEGHLETGADPTMCPCLDIDECSQPSPDGLPAFPCPDQSFCVDYDPPQRYKCECKPGFDAIYPEATSDPVPVEWRPLQCINVDECDAANNPCHPAWATCEDFQGAYKCTCIDGYEGDGVYCTLVAEPLDPSQEELCEAAKCNAVTQECVRDEIDGTFVCGCKQGFKPTISGDGLNDGRRGCENIDECGTGAHDCSVQADCFDYEGGFFCACKPGYEGTGMTCSNEDECLKELDNCHANATCVDTDGSFDCECNSGFDGDGSTACNDVDECALGTHNCDTNSNCSNTIGSFTCQCLPGFVGSGEECSDVNECDLGSHDCVPEKICVNTEGSFQCRNPPPPPPPPPETGVDVRDALEAVAPSEVLNAFPEDVFDEVAIIAPTFLVGSISSLAVPGETFTVPSGSTTFTFTGTFEVPEGETIPDDAFISVFSPAGLGSQSTVQPNGAFSLVIAAVPFGTTPFIVVVSSPSDEPNNRKLRQRSLVGAQNPSYFYLNNDDLPPEVSLTLTWSTPTSDIDLYVEEPSGRVIYYSQKVGINGFLDVDDVEGFGPEHYRVFQNSDLAGMVGDVYRIRVNSFHLDSDSHADWKLIARQRGLVIWEETGTFVTESFGSDSPASAWSETFLLPIRPLCKKKCVGKSPGYDCPATIQALIDDSSDRTWCYKSGDTDRYDHYGRCFRELPNCNDAAGRAPGQQCCYTLRDGQNVTNYTAWEDNCSGSYDTIAPQCASTFFEDKVTATNDPFDDAVCDNDATEAFRACAHCRADVLTFCATRCHRRTNFAGDTYYTGCGGRNYFAHYDCSEGECIGEPLENVGRWNEVECDCGAIGDLCFNSDSHHPDPLRQVTGNHFIQMEGNIRCF